jgi:hypothetical protein
VASELAPVWLASAEASELCGDDVEVWLASEDSGSEEESPEEDSSPIAARIASSQA